MQASRPNILTGFYYLVLALFEGLKEIGGLWGVLRRIYVSICRWRRYKKHRPDPCDINIPASEYRGPDPMIYSQFFIMAQGLSVTWDNPDIQLFDGGVPVSSHNLQADRDYDVVARIWNNSYHAPVANLPVYLSYLDFGVGTTPIPIQKTYVDLGVKGSPFAPAFANFTWHTPSQAGHYCLQVQLDWPDDANPANNLGQENTNVGVMHSPAVFEFDVHNDAGVTRRYKLEADMYRLPGQRPCPPEEPGAKKEWHGMTRLAESKQRWAQTVQAQGQGKFPVGADWQVDIDPQAFTLQPGATQKVRVAIEYLPGGFAGSQNFNIHCYAATAEQPFKLVGGVTLTVQGA